MSKKLVSGFLAKREHTPYTVFSACTARKSETSSLETLAVHSLAYDFLSSCSQVPFINFRAKIALRHSSDFNNLCIRFCSHSMYHSFKKLSHDHNWKLRGKNLFPKLKLLNVRVQLNICRCVYSNFLS